MNGQRVRREIVRELFARIRFDFVVETGTFRGVTTEFLLAMTESDVYSVEATERFYRYSQWYLNRIPGEYRQRLHTRRGDSREALRSLESEGLGFFYLDAHWGEDLPVWEEIEIIETKWRDGVILVDDFEVPGDPGYKFDDYGRGKTLTAENLPPSRWPDRTLYYPAARSETETGARRGCVVLTHGPKDFENLRGAR